jgi:hypothetical protein
MNGAFYDEPMSIPDQGRGKPSAATLPPRRPKVIGLHRAARAGTTRAYRMETTF